MKRTEISKGTFRVVLHTKRQAPKKFLRLAGENLNMEIDNIISFFQRLKDGSPSIKEEKSTKRKAGGYFYGGGKSYSIKL